jgi:hypothetical protein
MVLERVCNGVGVEDEKDSLPLRLNCDGVGKGTYNNFFRLVNNKSWFLNPYHVLSQPKWYSQ